jgi:hypothetical protein
LFDRSSLLQHEKSVAALTLEAGEAHTFPNPAEIGRRRQAEAQPLARVPTFARSQHQERPFLMAYHFVTSGLF